MKKILFLDNFPLEVIIKRYIEVYPNNKQCVQRTQYYPSGLPWYQGTGQSEQPYKYSGKEFVEMHGLDEYDSEARWYYPAIMRTTTMDPLCEKYYSISPYAWCGNNPVNIVDPDGRDWYYVLEDDGSRRYCYNPDVFSQDDLNESGIIGTYAGPTCTYQNIYYGLFDKKYNALSKYGQIVSQFESLLIRYERYKSGADDTMWESATNPTHPFSVEGLSNGSIEEYNYHGAKLIYYQYPYPNNKGNVYDLFYGDNNTMEGEPYFYGGYDSTEHKGWHIVIKNNKNSDIIHLKFIYDVRNPNGANAYKLFIKNYNKQFHHK